MDQVVDSVVKLPPLACGERPVSPGERALNLLAVFLLHAALAYGLLFISVKNELISLPPSISVRLLPMIETPVTEAKPLPPPPPKVPVRTQPVVRPQPVLAVASNTATSSLPCLPSRPPRRPSLSLPRHRQPRRR
jgi:protein TonB